MKIQLIAAVDSDWGIGYKGKLLFPSRRDLLHFKEKTLGHAVIMGRKTWESLPGGQPLSGRLNLVLSRNRNFKPEGVYVASGLQECRELLERFHIEMAFVIGGESVYRQFLSLASGAYITRISARVRADVRFPDLEREQGWVLDHIGECWEEEGIFYQICYYRCVKSGFSS